MEVNFLCWIFFISFQFFCSIFSICFHGGSVVWFCSWISIFDVRKNSVLTFQVMRLHFVACIRPLSSNWWTNAVTIDGLFIVYHKTVHVLSIYLTEMFCYSKAMYKMTSLKLFGFWTWNMTFLCHWNMDVEIWTCCYSEWNIFITYYISLFIPQLHIYTYRT